MNLDDLPIHPIGSLRPLISQESWSRLNSIFPLTNGEIKKRIGLIRAKSPSTASDRAFIHKQSEADEATEGWNFGDAPAAIAAPFVLEAALGQLLGRGAPDKVDRMIGITPRKYLPSALKELHNKGLSRYWAGTAGKTQLGPRAGHTVDHLLKKLKVDFTCTDTPYYAPAFLGVPATLSAGVRKGTSKANAQAILGHELGHAVRDRLGARSKLISRFYGVPGNSAAGLAAIAAGLFGGKNDTADAIMASTGALAMAPTIYEEMAASNVGARLLRLKGLSKLKTFAGVPTYLAAAATPAIAIGVRRGLKKLREKKNANN